ncbi:putative Translation initiation factor IF-2 [Leptomonas pyrrhocoris]|uniref:Putative Translation initiation factor IF-2 n=1 Tax=Leptomonas pyrrhocoris TaxID=157538 RepID=A0A0N0VET0_LEPPY|nr:putative Translation initiation factor IF-2 [Leptomonas pyrrhocoris]KPA79202.1 putative Translation initiation factor IF-2 [Leptomonas pyrrhocoris]|eukprot:XP_015657641.1 putative Translation initiation factor IF-2 [Leptomonas pyrrhocoris]
MAEKQELHSRAFKELAQKQARELCAPLTSLTRDEVEHIIKEKYKLTDTRVVTCLVPYQLGANVLLSRLPAKIRGEAVKELKEEEARRQEKVAVLPHKWIQWFDPDVYVSVGLKYIQRVSPLLRRRIPIFAILGHVNHGKTALLDSLQDSNIRDEEPHHITQSIRAFTVPSPNNAQDLFTFIDSPGHRIFVETRFHLHLVADFVLLVISVVDGIESQTHEAIKVALNVDKPVIVVLNKLDLLSDAFSAKKAVKRLLSELDMIGLSVQIIEKEKDVDKIEAEIRAAQTSRCDKTTLSVRHSQAEFFAPMKTVDPDYQGSKRHPQVNLHRKCYGVCVSATQKVHIPLLWRLLRVCRDGAPPMCHSNSVSYKESNAAVQAVVLESSKHLFDEEGFRLNRSRQRVQRAIDAKKQRRTNKFEKLSPRVRLNSMSNNAINQKTRQNRTSSTCLVITAIVREGVLSEGMHFIADQAEGQVHYLVDYWGNRIHKAYPGMAVTIVDKDSISGCPGAGIHVLSVTDLATRVRVQAYRQMLQWYVEVFTTKLHYLRPRGMDVAFAHLGDYGQLGITDSLECQLLCGPTAKSPENQTQLGSAPSRSPTEHISIGTYLAEKNKISESTTVQVSTAAASIALPDGKTKRLTQGIMDRNAELVVTSSWSGMQRTEPLASQKEYEQFVMQCVQVGVLIKVDSWHTARMLLREISRLGTRKVYFQVVGARFGPLQVDDILFFGQAVKVIVCFRTPIAASADLDKYIEFNDTWVLQTDHFSDVVLFMKWCAVATHKEKVTEDATDADSAFRPQIVVDSTKSAGSEAKAAKPLERKKKLLIYSDNSIEDG